MARLLLGAMLAGLCACTDEPTNRSPADAAPAAAEGITGLAIEPDGLVLAKGLQGNLTVLAVHADGNREDVTGDADWTSEAPAIAAVGNRADSKGLVSAAGEGQAAITAQYLGLSISAMIEVTPETLRQLVVTPADLSLGGGGSRQFIATGTYSDQSTRDLTALARWQSSQPDVAEVSNAAGSAGRVTGRSAGRTFIAARAEGLSSSSRLTVTSAALERLEVSPLAGSLPLNRRLQFEAVAHYVDGSAVDATTVARWSSDDPDILQIDAGGLARGVSQGRTIVRAQWDGQADAASLTVSAPVTLQRLQLLPTDPMIAAHTGLRLHLLAEFADGRIEDVSAESDWQSDTPAVASLDASVQPPGVVRSLAPGNARISASFEGQTAQTQLSVSAAELVHLAVDDSPAWLPLNSRRRFHATGLFSDHSRQDLSDIVNWTLADGQLGTIGADSAGAPLVSVTRAGTDTLRAGLNGIEGSAALTAADAELLSMSIELADARLSPGQARPLHATGLYASGRSAELRRDVVWWSGDRSRLTISNQPGREGLARAAAQASGNVTVFAHSDGQTASATLHIRSAGRERLELAPAERVLPVGLQEQLAATAVYADDSKQDVTLDLGWRSQDPARIAITGPGQVHSRAASAGEAVVIEAAAADTAQLPANARLFSTGARLLELQIEPAGLSVPAGTRHALLALGHYDDGQVRDLTQQVHWQAGAPDIATVGNAPGRAGVVLATGAGRTDIIATAGNGLSATSALDVSDATLQDITLSPGSSVLARDYTRQFHAIGQYSDGSQHDITDLASWQVADPALARVGHRPGTRGLLRALDSGQTRLLAHLDGIDSQPAAVEINTAPLTAISIAADTGEMPRGTRQPLRATGEFDGANPLDLTDRVIWSVSDAATLRIANANDSAGLLTATEVGTARVEARTAGVSGELPITVTAAVLQGLQITGPATLPRGFAVQLGAVAHYSDASSSEVSARWQSLDPAVASVDAAGRVTGIATGEVTISAEHQSHTARLALQVSNDSLTAIRIGHNDADGQIGPGGTAQFQALGDFASGLSDLPLTAQVSWSSSAEESVTIDQNGLASAALTPGTAAITASRDGVTSNAENLQYSLLAR